MGENSSCWQIAVQIAFLYSTLPRNLCWTTPSTRYFSITAYPVMFYSLSTTQLHLDQVLNAPFRQCSVIYGKMCTCTLEICMCISMRFCSSVSEMNCAWNRLLSALETRCKLRFKSWGNTQPPKSSGLKRKCEFKAKD